MNKIKLKSQIFLFSFLLFLSSTRGILSSSQKQLLIKNGLIITSSQSYQSDILVENGKILGIGKYNNLPDADTIDATGNFIFPGAIDVHTHMDLDVGFTRAVDDFYHGTVAAAMGGTTTIVDHMAFGPKGINLHHQLNVYHGLADHHAVIDYGFHGVAQHVNDDILNELESMAKDGVTSIKCYMTYDSRLNDAEIFQILRKMKEINGVTAVHCENHEIVEFLKKEYVKNGKTSPYYHAKSRPNQAEAEAIDRLLRLAKLAGDAPVYIVHLSTKEGLEVIRNARKNGQKNIFAETCPQYLILTEEKYKQEDGLKYVMSPPLRTKEDNEALWEGLADGSIQVVATDHCPFNYKKEKQMGKDNFTKCPNGGPGVEERLMLLYSEGVAKGKISLNQFVDKLSTSPAKIYGLSPEKGMITIGSDADFVIYNPNGSHILTHSDMHGSCDYTAYEGIEIKGNIQYVIQRGKIISKEGKFLGAEGDGKFIYRKGIDMNSKAKTCSFSQTCSSKNGEYNKSCGCN